jgi:hypothetical protein
MYKGSFRLKSILMGNIRTHGVNRRHGTQVRRQANVSLGRILHGILQNAVHRNTTRFSATYPSTE